MSVVGPDNKDAPMSYIIVLHVIIIISQIHIKRQPAVDRKKEIRAWAAAAAALISSRR